MGDGTGGFGLQLGNELRTLMEVLSVAQRDKVAKGSKGFHCELVVGWQIVGR